MPEHVLFCSSNIWSDYYSAIEAAMPGLDVVTLVAGQRVADADVARITIAFSSDDLFPAGLPSFFKVCLNAPSLEWVQLFNAGNDHPVFSTMLDRGLRLTTASGTSAPPIAHHVMLGLLALAHDLPRFMRDQNRRKWLPGEIGDLDGRTVGVLGMGPIGAEVARLAEQFGMRAIGMRRAISGCEPCETWTFDRLDELLRTVDDLVLALPLTTETRGIVGERELELMRPGSRIVNVGRGELVDEAALITALRSGHIGGASLDVFATEPLPATSELWAMPNVIITPHTSGSTKGSTRRVNQLFLDNLARFAVGEPLLNEVAR